jgi:thymidylate synthase ThyX
MRANIRPHRYLRKDIKMKLILPNANIDYVCGPSNDNSPKALIHALANNGRNCTGVADPNNYERDCNMVADLLKKQHGGALEFIDFHITFTVSRDIEMELVRHRMASWLWSSTRFINHTKKFGFEYILPTRYLKECDIDNPIITKPILNTPIIRSTIYNHIRKDNPSDDVEYPYNELIDSTMWHCTDGNSHNPIYLSESFARWISSKIDCEKNYVAAIEAGGKPEEARGYLSGDFKATGKCKMNMRELLHFLKLRMDPHAHPDIVYVACMIGRQFNEMFKDIPYEFEHTQYLST